MIVVSDNEDVRKAAQLASLTETQHMISQTVAQVRAAQTHPQSHRYPDHMEHWQKTLLESRVS